MSDIPNSEFYERPRLNFVDEEIGAYDLDVDTIKLYHSEAVEQAAAVCTQDIAQYYSGSLLYNRATSRPVPYMNGVFIGLGLTVGPRSLFDIEKVESVELGLVKEHAGSSPKFHMLAELKADRVKTGGILKPRINDPQDLDSFMRGLRYIVRQIVI